MDNKIGAVITGGDFQGLAVLRTLASKGIPVILIDNEHCIGKYSKYNKKFFRAPSPMETEKYIEFLIALNTKHDLSNWIIFPNSDQIVYDISKYKNELSKYYTVPLPDFDIINNVYNKNQTYKICKDNKLPYPKTYFSKNLDELLSSELNFPLVIKPAIRDHYYSRIKKKAYKVNNATELKTIYENVSEIIPAEEILVQEYISGGPKNLYSYCPLFKNGEIVAGISARRSRQHPMDFGHATTFAEIVDIPQLKELAQKFLSKINYYGICEVEFMYDDNTKEYKLIEVNPRVWGWHSLAISAGVDLPYLLYLDILNKPLPKSFITKQMKWIRFTTDLPTAFSEIVKGKLKFTEYIKSLEGEKQEAVFSFKDPLPFFTELLMLPYLWLKRGF